MAENKKAHAHEEPSSFVRFVRKQVDPLSKVFAASPLAQLRIKTPQGSVTLVKATAVVESPVGREHGADARSSGESGKLAARYTPLTPAANGEAGRTYITINSEVVGIFHDLSEPPAAGEQLHSGQALGYIEALRLRNEVRCPIDSTLVAQVVVDGQPVDFGEALFVVDGTAAAALEAAEVPSVAAEPAPVPEPVEPPRL